MHRSQQVAAQLDRITAEFVAAVRAERGELPVAPADDDWPSACIQREKNVNYIYWQPVLRRSRIDFGGLEKALELTFPAELTAFFGRYWSAALPVVWEERTFDLLQLWNSQDENNLLHNYLGHALEKKRARENLTLFFAVVDDERFLSCDAQSGEVVLEEVGGNRPQPVAESLATLLEKTTGCAGTAQDD